MPPDTVRSKKSDVTWPKRLYAGKLQRVDLRPKEIRDDMKAVSGKDHLDALFDRWAT